MIITYGCMCGSEYKCGAHSNINKVPCAFLILREGKKLEVCTHCFTRINGDEIIAMMYDKNSNFEIFKAYDKLGYLYMQLRMRKQDDG